METKEVDETLYSERTLYLLNIRELRDLGRKFGVPSPTTMKKKELVDYILKVVYGEVTVPVRNSYGRPSTREFDMNKYVTKIKRNAEISNELKSLKLEDFGAMKVASASENYITNEFETRVVYYGDGKYYLRVREFVPSNDDIEIPAELAKKFGLENYDVVEIAKNGEMFKIISVNGIKKRTNFDKITVCGEQLCSGVSRDFYLRTKEDLRREMENLSVACEQNDVALIVFTTKRLSGKTTECVEYSEGEDGSAIYKKLVHFIGLCEKAVYNGQDFIVAFENADIVEDMLEYFELDVSVRIKRYLQTALPRFTSLGNIQLLFRCEKKFAK